MVVFLDLLGVGIIIPILPELFETTAKPLLLFGNVFDQKIEYLFYGALIAIYSLGRFFGAPFLGDLSDLFGRKKILAISLIGTASGYFLFSYGILLQSLEILFIARLIDGITGGNISTAQAVISDISSPKDSSKNFGIIGAAFGLGFIFGPFVGGVLSDSSLVSWFSPTIPFLFAAVLSVVSFILVWFFLPETVNNLKTEKSFSILSSCSHIAKAFKDTDLRRLFLVSFVFTVGFGFYSSFFAIYLKEIFNFSPRNIGIFFAYSGLWIAIVQIFLIPTVSRKFSDGNVLAISFLMTALSVLLYLLPKSIFFLYLVPPFAAIWVGFTLSYFMSFLSSKTNSQNRGEVMGINASMQAIGEIFPPLIAGVSAIFFSATAPLILSALTLVIAHFLIQKEVSKS